MKTFRLLIILFLIPLTFHAQTQKTLTGLWTGILSNDSTTVRKDQSFEIALTEYRGKVYGYSRSTFIVNDTLYYIMKRVKGTIVGNVCEVKDDEIISYNFRGKIDKGVKVITTFRMNKNDSTWHLNGEWTTNQTKKYYAVTGKVDLEDEPDLSKSKIFPHLEELNVAKDVPFYVEAKKEAEKKAIGAIAKNDPPVTKQAPFVKKEVVQQKPKETTAVAVTNNQKPITTREENKPAETIVSKPEPKTSEPVVINKPEPRKTEPAIVAKIEEKKQTVTETIAPVNNKKQEQPVASIPVEQKKPVETIVKETKKQEPPVIAVTEQKKTEPVVIPKTEPVVAPTAAALVKERKTIPAQEVLFVSDSLQLALYDNGEVDGDTVSVLMNGELIMAKQGLKVSAIRKTVYIQPGDNEFTLLLYAENLGKYPPNTGLLVVYDGEERYQVRFSADLQQNASIVFRRKK